MLKVSHPFGSKVARGHVVAYRQLFHGGAFLITGKEERNPMTIGWCSFGRLWHRPVLTVYVRKSRYSHGLIDRDGFFAIAFPQDDSMKKALAYCGSKSGCDINKLEILGLSTPANRGGGIDSIRGNFIHYECRVIGKVELQQGLSYLDEPIYDWFYHPEKGFGDSRDHRTIYYGSILAAYHTGQNTAMPREQYQTPQPA